MSLRKTCDPWGGAIFDPGYNVGMAVFTQSIRTDWH